MDNDSRRAGRAQADERALAEHILTKARPHADALTQQRIPVAAGCPAVVAPRLACRGGSACKKRG